MITDKHIYQTTTGRPLYRAHKIPWFNSILSNTTVVTSANLEHRLARTRWCTKRSDTYNTPCPEKKDPEHYRLSPEERTTILIIFGTFILGTTGDQINVQYSTSPNVCFCTTWVKQNHDIWDEMNRNTPKSIPNLNDCDWQIFVIFVANTFDTTCHQMTVLVPTSPNVCFCTT